MQKKPWDFFAIEVNPGLLTLQIRSCYQKTNTSLPNYAESRYPAPKYFKFEVIWPSCSKASRTIKATLPVVLYYKFSLPALRSRSKKKDPFSVALPSFLLLRATIHSSSTVVAVRRGFLPPVPLCSSSRWFEVVTFYLTLIILLIYVVPFPVYLILLYFSFNIWYLI